MLGVEQRTHCLATSRRNNHCSNHNHFCWKASTEAVMLTANSKNYPHTQALLHRHALLVSQPLLPTLWTLHPRHWYLHIRAPCAKHGNAYALTYRKWPVRLMLKVKYYTTSVGSAYYILSLISVMHLLL